MTAALLAVTALSLVNSPLRAPIVAARPAVNQRLVTGSPFAQQQQLEPEEVVEKYGLEAGLFSALKKGGSSSSDEPKKEGGVTAGDLLKRYGGAYLLTSTSFAIVSFAICYLAVDNGVDVGSLLQKVGLDVVVPEQAGTVGIAYALHKAASPIRFPPTVALTPVVAKRLFNNAGDADTAETD